MKIQLSLDRITIPQALEICKETADLVDIIEVGTSLIKEFGNASIEAIRKAYPHQTLLADSKTMDEGAYEFHSAYNAGADIVTVMGAASLETIKACYQVAQERKKDIMIDLLEVSGEKLQQLKRFDQAIFCLHLPSDKAGKGLEQMIQANLKRLQGVTRLAVAGGITLQTISSIVQADVEIAVIGGAITKSNDRRAAARQFRLATKGQ